MSRHTPKARFTALLVLAMLGGAGIALAQTATVKARDPGSPDPLPAPGPATASVKTRDPVPPKPVPAPATTNLSASVPTARVDLYEIGRSFEPGFSPGFSADLSVWADNVHLGGYTTLNKESVVYVRVANKFDRSAAPAGTYNLHLKVANVADAATLLIQANGETRTCNFKRLQGYMNLQPCEVTFTTKGAALDARIRYTQGPPSLTLHSIEASKIR